MHAERSDGRALLDAASEVCCSRCDMLVISNSVFFTARISISHTSSVQTISEYNLVEPSEEDARAALKRVFGAVDGESRWSQACVAVGLQSGYVRPGDELERVTSALSLQGGATSAVARSILIRMRTFYRIAARLDHTSARARS